MLVENCARSFLACPIVVDFRDEWHSTTIDLVGFQPQWSVLSGSRHAEASAVINATAVVAVTEAPRREIRARYPEEPE